MGYTKLNELAVHCNECDVTMLSGTQRRHELDNPTKHPNVKPHTLGATRRLNERIQDLVLAWELGHLKSIDFLEAARVAVEEFIWALVIG